MLLVNVISNNYEYNSIEDQLAEIERAIDEIVDLNINGKYKKVTRTLSA